MSSMRSSRRWYEARSPATAAAMSGRREGPRGPGGGGGSACEGAPTAPSLRDPPSFQRAPPTCHRAPGGGARSPRSDWRPLRGRGRAEGFARCYWLGRPAAGSSEGWRQRARRRYPGRLWEGHERPAQKWPPAPLHAPIQDGRSGTTRAATTRPHPRWPPRSFTAWPESRRGRAP